MLISLVLAASTSLVLAASTSIDSSYFVCRQQKGSVLCREVSMASSLDDTGTIIMSQRRPTWCIACRKALRLAASDLGQSQATQQPRHNLSDPTSLHKDCDFSLDLKLLTAANSSDSQNLAPTSEVSELQVATSSLLGRFWRQNSQEQLKQPQDLILNGTLQSGNCGLELQINATTTHVEVYEAKAINYTFMVTALTFIQVCLTWKPRRMEAYCCPQYHTQHLPSSGICWYCLVDCLYSL